MRAVLHMQIREIAPGTHGGHGLAPLAGRRLHKEGQIGEITDTQETASQIIAPGTLLFPHDQFQMAVRPCFTFPVHAQTRNIQRPPRLIPPPLEHAVEQPEPEDPLFLCAEHQVPHPRLSPEVGQTASFPPPPQLQIELADTTGDPFRPEHLQQRAQSYSQPVEIEASAPIVNRIAAAGKVCRHADGPTHPLRQHDHTIQLMTPALIAQFDPGYLETHGRFVTALILPTDDAVPDQKVGLRQQPLPRPASIRRCHRIHRPIQLQRQAFHLQLALPVPPHRDLRPYHGEQPQGHALPQQASPQVDPHPELAELQRGRFAPRIQQTHVLQQQRRLHPLHPGIQTAHRHWLLQLPADPADDFFPVTFGIGQYHPHRSQGDGARHHQNDEGDPEQGEQSFEKGSHRASFPGEA